MNSAAITVDSQGRRHYLRGNTYPIKNQLRDAGCKWDGAEKAWWTGKLEVAERFAGAAVAPAPKSDPGQRASEAVTDATVLLGRGEYKGRPCLVLWLGRTSRGEAAKLASMDGGRTWWADAAEVTITKRYQERERFGGYGRGTVREPMTFGRLQALREDGAAERAAEKAEAARPKDPREQQIQRKADGRNDVRYSVGATIHAGKVTGGGGPDGCWWTVVACQRPFRNEDLGYYDWTETATVRPATDEEVAARTATAPQAVAS
jgi:hypothetical protein